MQKETFEIEKIPSLLWGKDAEKVILAVHGNQSNKADVPMEILAKQALPKGYQILSFDLPGHGERKEEAAPCRVQPYIQDLLTVMQYAKKNWKQISLFANSMGAYFSLLAYQMEPLERAWFLSPVVAMQRLIKNMMVWFQITEEQLKKEHTIVTPIGQTLYWDYYCYVKEHPIHEWKVPTYTLYGGKDALCEKEVIIDFTEKFSCQLQIEPEAEHYFHTPEQLQILEEWIRKTI